MPVEQIPAPAPATAGAAPAPESLAAAAGVFAPDWYRQHPDAWRPVESATDWRQAADVAAVTAWLGSAVRPAGNVAAESGPVTTAGGDAASLDGTKSVLVLPAGHDERAGDPAAGNEWLPLGAFAVASPGSSQPHLYQQLAVDRSGSIRGSSYDAISDTIQPITGRVDRNALTASWTVGSGGSRFEAQVESFTAQPHAVTLMSGGKPQAWELKPLTAPQ